LKSGHRIEFLLAFIAVMFALLVARQYQAPAIVHAQSSTPNYYVEPGYLTLRSPDGLRQVQGKMVVNMENGEIWGFPTLVNGPYPVDPTKSKPPVSEPIYLGQFNFASMKRAH
jgi:hypothetical protein